MSPLLFQFTLLWAVFPRPTPLSGPVSPPVPGWVSPSTGFSGASAGWLWEPQGLLAMDPAFGDVLAASVGVLRPTGRPSCFPAPRSQVCRWPEVSSSTIGGPCRHSHYCRRGLGSRLCYPGGLWGGWGGSVPCPSCQTLPKSRLSQSFNDSEHKPPCARPGSQEFSCLVMGCCFGKIREKNHLQTTYASDTVCVCVCVCVCVKLT